tara:strand:+ start:175 stop:540 length:366 start_codon:yes stop_codon:yes gene_type:complete
LKKETIILNIFLSKLDREKFFLDFDLKGISNYALIVILKNKNKELMQKIEKNLSDNGIEYRIGSAGGGNQLRQPYIRNSHKGSFKIYGNTEHMHFYSLYIGNYPDLKREDIDFFTKVLNTK